MLEGELIRMVTKKHPLGKRFFRLEVDGKLKLLSFFAIDFSSGDNNISSVYSDKKYYFLEKDDNIVLSKKWPLFPSQMSKYLADCPILVEKIKHGEYRNSNLPEMVNAYNETCSSENQ